MPNSDDDTVVVSVRVDEELEEQFILAFRQAQTEGYAPASGDRSEAIRQLMRAMVNKPEIIKYGASDSEFEAAGES